jgi:hypothetical protein
MSSALRMQILACSLFLPEIRVFFGYFWPFGGPGDAVTTPPSLLLKYFAVYVKKLMYTAKI